MNNIEVKARNSKFSGSFNGGAGKQKDASLQESTPRAMGERIGGGSKANNQPIRSGRKNKHYNGGLHPIAGRSPSVGV